MNALLKVRLDWIKKLVLKDRRWGPIASYMVKENYFFAIPFANYPFQIDDGADGDLVILEGLVNDNPPIFRTFGNMIACVNYRSAYKPMTQEEFLIYLKKVGGKWTRSKNFESYLVRILQSNS